MKVLVLLAVIGVCRSAILHDTPEVQTAKRKFFQEFNRIASRSTPIHHQATQNHHRFSPQPYRGPLASTIPAGVDGRVVPVGETAEVAAARREFEAAFQNQLRAVGSSSHATHATHNPIFRSSAPSNNVWTGSLATHLPAGVPGAVQQVPNTREVEEAIADFNRHFQRALGQSSRRSFSAPSGHFVQASSGFDIHTPRWTGPLASNIPAGVPGSVGQVPETHEVAAARAEFERAFRRQLHKVRG